MFYRLTVGECRADEFVDFWSSLYSGLAGDVEALYVENINKPEFSPYDLMALFQWKNGMRLSALKNTTLQEKILRKLPTVNKLKKHFSLGEFEQDFPNLGTIWKIFLLHCIQPDTYPIFDQHVFRAMCYLQDHQVSEVSGSDRQKYRQYLDLYLPYFNTVVEQSCCSKVKADRALWMFGKALKLTWVQTIFQSCRV